MAEYCCISLDNIRDCVRLFKFEIIEPEHFGLAPRSFSLSSLPSYIDLPYKWGDGNEKQWLNVDGCMLKIPANLHQFLSVDKFARWR
jgi:hypothetical protein